jgi:hypothetical protein
MVCLRANWRLEPEELEEVVLSYGAMLPTMYMICRNVAHHLDKGSARNEAFSH